MSKHSIRIGICGMPSSRWSPSSASIRWIRRCSERSRSWSSASRAFRSASSRIRRLSPRSAWRTSTGPPRRSASASASTPASCSARWTTTSGGIAGERGVVLEHELLGHLAPRRGAPGCRGRSSGGRPARRRGPGTPARSRRSPRSRPRSRRASRPTRSRSAGARAGCGPPSACCGSPRRSRTPAPPTRASSRPRGRARSGGSGRRGSRRPSRSPRGTPPPTRSRRRAPRSA